MKYQLVRKEFEPNDVVVDVPRGALAVGIIHTAKPVEEGDNSKWFVHPIIVIEYLQPAPNLAVSQEQKPPSSGTRP